METKGFDSSLSHGQGVGPRLEGKVHQVGWGNVVRRLRRVVLGSSVQGGDASSKGGIR